MIFWYLYFFVVNQINYYYYSFQTCYNNWEQAVRTQLVDSLFQTCYIKLGTSSANTGVVKTRNAGISRNMAEYGGISRNMAEYHGIFRNNTEYHGISRHFPGIYRNITIFTDGSHATVYQKHGRLTTYFITLLSHFDGK